MLIRQNQNNDEHQQVIMLKTIKIERADQRYTEKLKKTKECSKKGLIRMNHMTIGCFIFRIIDVQVPRDFL